MKKYKLEILVAGDTDNCEYIEETMVEEEENTFQMDDTALYMTQLLLPLLDGSPREYHQSMNAALISGCIVGDA